MRFLFVGTHPENTGAATHFVALAQALVESGHDVDAILRPDTLIWEGLAYSGVRCREGFFRNALDPSGYAAVRRQIAEARPDWIVGNFGKEYWPLVLIGRALGIPVALFRHRTPPMKRLSALLLPRLATRFFAVSRHARQAYLDRGIAASRVQVLYNPVNAALFRPDADAGAAMRASLGLPADAIVLGYVGRMQTGKGVFPLLEAATQAMRREPRLHCLWVGDGPDAADLRARAGADPALGGRHRFTGWTNQTADYFRSLSMLAFPSIATETFGRTSIEAQACGVPVLASDIGGVPETLSHGESGLLLPLADVPAWRDAILAMCDDATRQRMGEAAREFVLQRFATHVIARDFVAQLQPEAADQGSAGLGGLGATTG
ncbi:MAG: glycosyltransferase family 4 protein [Xanthomonadaceae bacterium]|nr:glycosyltransferase family 4 protein [Xanthomonadaceae bacterium]MDE1965361.1 glycosyltransferase family 4 protein [Xanthomonadaceae bacterium]